MSKSFEDRVAWNIHCMTDVAALRELAREANEASAAQEPHKLDVLVSLAAPIRARLERALRDSDFAEIYKIESAAVRLHKAFQS
jgi:hypothetical protein